MYIISKVLFMIILRVLSFVGHATHVDLVLGGDVCEHVVKPIIIIVTSHLSVFCVL